LSLYKDGSSREIKTFGWPDFSIIIAQKITPFAQKVEMLSTYFHCRAYAQTHKYRSRRSSFSYYSNKCTSILYTITTWKTS